MMGRFLRKLHISLNYYINKVGIAIVLASIIADNTYAMDNRAPVVTCEVTHAGAQYEVESNFIINLPLGVDACREAGVQNSPTLSGLIDSLYKISDRLAKKQTASLIACADSVVDELIKNNLNNNIDQKTIDALIKRNIPIISGYYGLDKLSTYLDTLALDYGDTLWGQYAFLRRNHEGWRRTYGDLSCPYNSFPEVIKYGEAYIKKYPKSPIANDVALQVAIAYDNWWSVHFYNPETQLIGGVLPFELDIKKANMAREKALDIYRKLSSKQSQCLNIADKVKLLEAKQPTQDFTYITSFCE